MDNPATNNAGQLTVQAAAAISAANTAAAAAASTSTALAALVSSANSAAHPSGGVAMVAALGNNGRDPMLSAFENYLLKNMRASDVVHDEEGILLFNVNQVAYLMEGSAVNEEQRQTRKRIYNFAVHKKTCTSCQ